MTMRTPKLLPAQYIVYTDDAAFTVAFARVRKFVEYRALKVSDGDPDWADDLVQEARVHLWELDPSRYTAADDAFVRASLWRRMIDCARAERDERFTRIKRTRPGKRRRRAAHVGP